MMYSDKIEAQGFAVRVLRSHIQKQRLSHAYLFTGEKNSGKEDLAQALAAAVNCEKERSFRECECKSCGKIEAGNHPDVRGLGKDPKIRSIKIEEVRDTLSAASLKTYEGNPRSLLSRMPDGRRSMLRMLSLKHWKSRLRRRCSF